jgi:hypothetical protein
LPVKFARRFDAAKLRGPGQDAPLAAIAGNGYFGRHLKDQPQSRQRMKHAS